MVGGGLIGLSIAWRLRQSGLTVSVWDAAVAGQEASWAGAGMLAPGGEFETRSWWSDLALQSANLYPDFVEELQALWGQPIDYRACGALETVSSEAEWQALLQRAERQREWGIRVDTAGPQTLFYPDDAAVDPRHLVQALRAACERTGVVFHEQEAVRRIVVRQGRITEPEPASKAVLAAGAWSSGVEIQIEGSGVALEPAVPVRGHLVCFPPSGALPGPLLRQGHTYVLERANGATIAGSTTERVGFLREPDQSLFADVERRARLLMPRLNHVQPASRWTGFRPGTESGEPAIGRYGDSPLYLAYGHYRNGILMAPATARLLARLIAAN